MRTGSDSRHAGWRRAQNGWQSQRRRLPPDARGTCWLRPRRQARGCSGSSCRPRGRAGRERFPLQVNRTALSIFDLSHFLSENRCPLFRKMLYGAGMMQPQAQARRSRGVTALIVLAAALAACSTLTKQTTSSEEEDTAYSAAPANIASLAEVVQRNPSDPQAFNMRGTVLGRAGRYEEALADFNKAISLD